MNKTNYINSNYIIDTSSKRSFTFSSKDILLIDIYPEIIPSRGFVAKNQRFSNMQNVFEKETLYREEYLIINKSI